MQKLKAVGAIAVATIGLAACGVASAAPGSFAAGLEGNWSCQITEDRQNFYVADNEKGFGIYSGVAYGLAVTKDGKWSSTAVWDSTDTANGTYEIKDGALNFVIDEWETDRDTDFPDDKSVLGKSWSLGGIPELFASPANIMVQPDEAARFTPTASGGFTLGDPEVKMLECSKLPH